MNQHENTKTVAAKKATTARLQSEVKPEPVVIPVVRSSDETWRLLNERMFGAQNRTKVLEGQIHALREELADETRVLESMEAALAVLDQSNKPTLVEKLAS